jgi:hypothetical protein
MRAPDWGLVPKQCETEIVDGTLKVSPTGRVPFLGTAQVKLRGPLSLKMTLRAEQGGKGRIQWRTAAQDSFPEEGQVVEYALSGGKEWEPVEIEIPVKGVSATIRIFLPNAEVPVEIRSIEFKAANRATKSWSF